MYPKKEFLSKVKCVYDIYPSVNGIAIERRPVAYINQDYAYLIIQGRPDLKTIPTYNIHDKDDMVGINRLKNFALNRYIPEDLTIQGRNYRQTYTQHFYFYDIPEGMEELKDEAIKRFKDYHQHGLELQYKAELKDLERRKAELERVLAEVAK